MDNQTTTKDLVTEMIGILYRSTKELSTINTKTLEDHEQIRKNCETVVAFMNAYWI